MTPRWFAFLLCAFLAAPLCCCGWQGLRAAAPAEAAMTCALCHEAELAASDSQDETCPCMKDLAPRDLAPRQAVPSEPSWHLALLPETEAPTAGAEFALSPAHAGQPFRLLPTGPPRLYLKHQALTC